MNGRIERRLASPPRRSQPLLTPAAMVAAMLAFAVAALTVGLTPYQPAWWPGAVTLAVLGGIVPVFARRAWPAPNWGPLAVALTLAGAWLAFTGILAGASWLIGAGHALALAGGILFSVTIARLFRQPVTLPAPPLPYPGQTAVDRIATRFMRLSGSYLLFALAVGLFVSIWHPGGGRWDLVWVHAMLIGFFLSMVSGVCCHVLTRWTGARWRAVAPIQLHFVVVLLGLPLMLLALASDRVLLFAIAGPLQAAGIGLLLLNIAPLMPALPSLTRPAFAMAAFLLAVGVTFGALFALDPALGARLRLTHAEIHLFGWTGLLISGAGYYLVPRFAGQPLRWPRLAPLQLALLSAGVVLGAAAFAWRAYGSGPAVLVIFAQGLVAAGFLLFAVLIAGTFRPMRRSGAVAALLLVTRPAHQSPARPA